MKIKTDKIVYREDLYPRFESIGDGIAIFKDRDVDLGYIEKGIFYALNAYKERALITYKKWMSELPYIKTKHEKDFQRFFTSALQCKYEEQVKTKYGIIDVLTDSAIYELKYNPDLHALHSALGQLLFYACKYSGKQLVLVTNRKIKNNFKELFNANNIKVENYKF